MQIYVQNNVIPDTQIWPKVTFLKDFTSFLSIVEKYLKNLTAPPIKTSPKEKQYFLRARNEGSDVDSSLLLWFLFFAFENNSKQLITKEQLSE